MSYLRCGCSTNVQYEETFWVYCRFGPQLSPPCMWQFRSSLRVDTRHVHMPRERLSDELLWNELLCLPGCPVTAGLKIALDVQGGKVSNRDGSWDLGVRSHQCPQLCLYDRMLWQDPCFITFRLSVRYMLAPVRSEPCCTSQGHSCGNKAALNKYLS